MSVLYIPIPHNHMRAWCRDTPVALGDVGQINSGFQPHSQSWICTQSWQWRSKDAECVRMVMEQEKI